MTARWSISMTPGISPTPCKLHGERLQPSGGTDGEAFTLTTNEPNRLAGKLHIDDTAADGAKVDATFDLTLLNTFATVR